MLTTESTAIQKLNLNEAPSVVKCRPNQWLTIWTAMLAINGGCYMVVWLNSLGADPLRQILAGALTALSAYLAWKKDASNKSDQSSTQHKPSKFAFIALVTTCLIILVTGNLHTARVFLFANIALLMSFAWAFFGWQRCKVLAPAAFLSLFTLPDLPEEFRAYLFIPLQHICTVTAGEIAKLFVPLTYSGHVFTVDGQQLNVAPSCAGLGMWACFLFAFAIWQGFKKYKPSAYLAAFITDPILVMTLNTVRIALTAIVAHYHSMRLALEIHSKLEFILVPLGLFILWKVGAHFAESN
ncbi:hypothetical protein BH10CYA1_BH10CYA1_02370 [soil metagenome]